MRIKNGVSLEGLKPCMYYAIGIAEVIFGNYAKRLVVTSGTDGKHSPRSKHYSGEGVDFRIRGFSQEELAGIKAELAMHLDPLGFDVVLEGDHFHVEYDPKENENWIKEVA